MYEIFLAFKFKSNCVNETFRRKHKNFELYLFLMFGNCRSGFLEDGPAFSMSISLLKFQFMALNIRVKLLSSDWLS